MKYAIVIVFTLVFSVGSFAQGAKNRSVTFEGAKINYADTGKRSDKALVFVHCWTCNADFWRDSAKAFPNYRVITMDLPGHGTSDKPKVDYTIDYFARSVDAVLKDAKIKRAVLVGHSMGTPVIRKYYETYPTKVAALVLVDGALLPPDAPRAEVDKFFAPMYADYGANAGKFIDSMLPTDAKLRAYISNSMLSTPNYVATSAMKLMMDDAYNKHGNIRVPVLAVMAPSEYWPKDIEARYRAIAPNLQFMMWTGTSHFLHMERPKEFNDAVSTFIVKNKLL